MNEAKKEMAAPPATKAIAPIDEVRATLLRLTPEFKMALPPQVTPEKFIRVTLTALRANPDLLSNRQSLYSAAMKCAQDGLLPDGRQAAFVKFGGDVVYMPMISGILQKIRNSGELAMITAQIVYSNDKFRYWIDSDGEHIEHEPLIFGERGALNGVYAFAKTKDGASYIDVMTKDEIEKVRNVSRAKDSGPWKTWFEEMAKKSAIRRLSKRLPMSTDVQNVIEANDDLNDIAGQEIKAPESKSSRLENIIDAETKTEIKEEVPAA